jgi:DNA (cytosine-5)-methyltransferase 1
MKHKVRIADLFAGLGGIRLGFSEAFEKAGYEVDCVFTSEIKKHAVETLKINFPKETITGDITKVDAKSIPDFDFLLAGFPCQPFSYAGKREGFNDTRGTLFFDIERILKEKKPYGFILENVEGLVKHDLANPKDPIGRTLSTILNHLNALGYKVSYRVLNSNEFGLPQVRKRIYIVGVKKGEAISLLDFPYRTKKVKDVLEKGEPTLDTDFTRKILSHYSIKELEGKSVNDKRGGLKNIHSWDFKLKGKVSEEQKIILTKLFKERRKKHWAKSKGIAWMDGMSLTLSEISTFCDNLNLEELLEDLVSKGYLAKEHPKNITCIPIGYNIITGKLSFEFSCILDPNGTTPTLVASDLNKIGVADGKGIRRLTVREGLRMFGFPETYNIEVPVNKAYDLLGNSVAVPVVEAVSERLAEHYTKSQPIKK